MTIARIVKADFSSHRPVANAGVELLFSFGQHMFADGGFCSSIIPWTLQTKPLGSFPFTFLPRIEFSYVQKLF